MRIRERFLWAGAIVMVLGYAACSVSMDVGAELSGNPNEGGGPGNQTTTGTGPLSDIGDQGGLTNGNETGTPPDGAGEGGKGNPFNPAPTCKASGTRAYAMSADDSNSMGSPGYVRDILNAGKAPDAALIRTYEFLNYYNVGYENAPDGELSIIPELVPDKELPGEYRLQIGVQSGKADPLRHPMAVTIVVDTSASMAGRSIQNARQVVKAIAGSLKDGDVLSLLTLDADVAPLDDGTVINEKSRAKVSMDADKLSVGGAADLQGGLVRGYSLAHSHYNDGGMNRLVLITDGRANPSSINPEFIAEHAKNGDEAGIYLVGVGTGPAEGYNDALLNELTDYGRGAYVYIDSKDEADKMFGARFSEVMEIAARSVSVQVTLPNHFGVQHFFGEKISTPGQAPPPQHLAPGDAMVFNMTLESVYGTYCSGDEIIVDVTWENPISKQPGVTPQYKTSIEKLVADPSMQMKKANVVIAYAEALKSFNVMRLQNAQLDVQALINERAKLMLAEDKDLTEIKNMLAQHPLLKK